MKTTSKPKMLQVRAYDAVMESYSTIAAICTVCGRSRPKVVCRPEPGLGIVEGRWKSGSRAGPCSLSAGCRRSAWWPLTGFRSAGRSPGPRPGRPPAFVVHSRQGHR
jgi:hypothetical protein